MSLPWSEAQVEWLREMGFDVLALRGGGQAAAHPPLVARDVAASEAGLSGAVPHGLARAARDVDLSPLLADGMPRDVAGRRALWRALRPLRKASRTS